MEVNMELFCHPVFNGTHLCVKCIEGKEVGTEGKLQTHYPWKESQLASKEVVCSR